MKTISLVQFCIAVGIVDAFSFHAASTLRYHVHNLQIKTYLLRSIHSTRISITSDDACDATKFNSTATSYLSGNQQTPEIQRTLYEILDTSPNATRNELKQAYIKLARKTHPDAIRHKDDEEQPNESTAAVDFNEIAQAWRTLSNPLERKRYDRKLQAKAFTRNVEMYVGTFSRRAGPPVRKAFEISMPILRKTTAATIAGFNAVAAEIGDRIEIDRTAVETKGKRSNSVYISEKNKNMVTDNDNIPDLVKEVHESQNDQYDIIKNKNESDLFGVKDRSEHDDSSGDSQEMSELVESKEGTKNRRREEYRKAFIVQAKIRDRVEYPEVSKETMDIDKSMTTTDVTKQKETVKVKKPKKSKAKNPVRKEKANVIINEIESDSETVQKSVQFEHVKRSTESNKVIKKGGKKSTDNDTDTLMEPKTLHDFNLSQNSSQSSRESDSAKRSRRSYVNSKERTKISDKRTEIEMKSTTLQGSKSPVKANQTHIQSEPVRRLVENKATKKDIAEKTESKKDILKFRQSEPANRSRKSKTTKKKRKKTDDVTKDQMKFATLQGSQQCKVAGQTLRLSNPAKNKVTKKERTIMTDHATESDINSAIQGSKSYNNDILRFRQSEPAKRSSESKVTNKEIIKKTDRVTSIEIKPETLQGFKAKSDHLTFSQSKTSKRSGESKVTKKELIQKADPATDIEMKSTTLQGSKSSRNAMKKTRQSESIKRTGDSKLTKKERIKKTGLSTKTEMSNDKSGSKSVFGKNTSKYKFPNNEKKTDARVGDMPDSMNATQLNVDRTKPVKDKKEAQGFQRRKLKNASTKAGKKRRQQRGKR